MTKGKKKMERFDDSGNERRVENRSHQGRENCPNIHQEISNIFSQVQMMSDSLAACSQMSKYRPRRKSVKINDRSSTQFSSIPQVSVPAEDKNSDGRHSHGLENIAKVDKKGEKHHSRNFGSREEFKSKSISDKSLGKSLNDRYHPDVESLNSSNAESREMRKSSSRVRMYEPGEVIPERMIDIIQRELKTLMKLTPALASLLVTMSDTMLHYKDCSKCRNKIYPAFPWILNRLQKLIKFTVTKRQGTYIWPNDYSYLRLVPDEPIVDEPEDKHDKEDKDKDFECENIEPTLSQKSDPAPEETKVQLGRLEEVDPLIVADSRPGVQIFLEVQSRQVEKRFFLVGQKFRYNFHTEFPVVEFQELRDIPVVLILRPSPELIVNLSEKRVLSTPKLISHRSSLRYKLPSLVQELILSPASWGRIRKVKKEQYKKEVFLLQRLKFLEHSSNNKEKSNEKVSYFTKNTLMNFSTLVFDFVTEGKEENMQMQKVRELEAEVKELKSLMLEVRRNQAKLSKVLLKKGVCSLPLLRFTNPEILQEEDWVVSKVDEIQLHKTKISSLEALQSSLSDLKRKCNLKHKLILTLLKGFESNVPKEWWNEIMKLMFGDTSDEDLSLSAESVGDLIRKASFFLRNGEQASTTSLPSSRFEKRSSKEEPIMKGNMGADIQDNLKILSDLDYKWAKTMDDTLLPLDCQIPMKFFAYPAVVRENLGSSIRRLEYQVSILNVENERLWHEILDLKDILKSSVKGLSQKMSSRTTDKQVPLASRSNGRSINITIHIASDKDRRISTEEPLKITKVNESPDQGTSKGSKSFAPTKHSPENYFSILQEKLDYEDAIQDKKMAVLATGSKLPVKTEIRRSTNDFNYLDDLNSSDSVSAYQENEEKVNEVLQARTSSPSVEQLMMGNSNIPEQGIWKNIQAVPSMHVVNEATTSYLAGPSRKRLDVDYYFRSPSGMDLCETQNDDALMSVSKERELHPIPEDDDDLDPKSSGSVNEAIQHLRGRVRSIHKDVKVLKSKNDRIDKVLNKLVDDIKNNNESFEEIQKAMYLKP